MGTVGAKVITAKKQGPELEEQQKQLKQKLSQKKLDTQGKTGPQQPPWVKGVPTRGLMPNRRRNLSAPEAPSADAPPGPDKAKQKTLQGAKDRKPKAPEQKPNGPGSSGERPRRSRLEAFLQLLGMTKFGQKILAKADKIERNVQLMKDLFGRKPNKKRQFDPSVEQRQTQQARRFDQEKQARIQQIIIIRQQMQSPGAPKPTPSQPKRALGDRAIGQHRQQPKPEVGKSTKPPLSEQLKQDQGKTGPKQTKSAPIPRSKAPKQQLKQTTSTPSQKPLSGSKFNKTKDKTLKSGPSLDDM